MSGQKSSYLEKAELDACLGGSAWTPPATVYLALFTVKPAADGTGGTEATGSGYARKSITNNSTNFPAATGGSPATKTLHVSTAMATATGDWSAAANQVAWALFDASTSGNMLWFGDLTTAKPVLSGDTPTFAADALAVTST